MPSPESGHRQRHGRDAAGPPRCGSPTRLSPRLCVASAPFRQKIQHHLLDLRGVAAAPPAGPAAGPDPTSTFISFSLCEISESVVVTILFRSASHALRLRPARERQQVGNDAAHARGFAAPPGTDTCGNPAGGPAECRRRSECRCISIERFSTPESGLLISCATLAESCPSEASRSRLQQFLVRRLAAVRCAAPPWSRVAA